MQSLTLERIAQCPSALGAVLATEASNERQIIAPDQHTDVPFPAISAVTFSLEPAVL